MGDAPAVFAVPQPLREWVRSNLNHIIQGENRRVAAAVDRVSQLGIFRGPIAVCDSPKRRGLQRRRKRVEVAKVVLHQEGGDILDAAGSVPSMQLVPVGLLEIPLFEVAPGD